MPDAFNSGMRHSWMVILLALAAPAALRMRPAVPAGCVESLVRTGHLYLSLMDCIALAIEDHLDVAVQRYGPRIAGAHMAAANGMAAEPNTACAGAQRGPDGTTCRQHTGAAFAGNARRLAEKPWSN